MCSARSKHHVSPARAERCPKRRPSNESQRQLRIPRPTKKKANTKPVKIAKGAESNRPRLRRRNVPLFKDPLASSKLEMIKNIRARRVAAGTEKFQAIKRAKYVMIPR